MTNTISTYRPKSPILVQVKDFIDVSLELRRITFYGSGLKNYPSSCTAAHLKIFLPRADQLKPTLPERGEKGPVWPEDAVKPAVRTYTVRSIRPELHEIDIEFVLHGDSGPASRFAAQAKAGQYIGISFPGGPSPLDQFQHNYLVGDNTALPAIAAILEAMPKQSQGDVYILLNNANAQIELVKPDNIKLHWFIGEHEQQTQHLIASFKSTPLELDNSYFWLAGENDLVIELRNYLRREKDVAKERLYAVPYWRRGSAEEQYHKQRHQVMDQE
jgi:NADPH-dependent ferric siderophore reductase